jgi:hypothetical protein
MQIEILMETLMCYGHNSLQLRWTLQSSQGISFGSQHMKHLNTVEGEEKALSKGQN